MNIFIGSEKELAIHGGRPVRETMLPYGRHWIDADDIQNVIDVLSSDWITTGPMVPAFESAFAEYVGAREAVSFSSGTAALHGAVFAAGIGPGDEAITSPMTFCASANCVIYQGGRPVFADILPDSLNIDPERIAEAITARTKAVIPVDYAGAPADYDRIMALAEKHDLVVIEDACHALGALYKGRKVGSFADMTTFSFHPVKHITTGEGGMVTTNRSDLADRLRLFRNHGIDHDVAQRQIEGRWQYDMVALGYNYRLTDMGSALGLGQLSRIEEKLKSRREIAEHYKAGFRKLAEIILPAVESANLSAWHLYPIRVNPEKTTMSRPDIFAALRAENIGVNVHYIPLHYFTYYRNRFGYQGGEFPVAEAAYHSLISLPIFSSMTQKDVNDVIEAVRKVFDYFK